MRASAISLLLIAGLLHFCSRPALAQGVITPVGPLTVTTAVAGSQPAPVTGSVNYSATLAFPGQMKVVGQLNVNMPAFTTLAVKLSAPSGGTSLGNVNLDTTPRDLVIAATPPFFTNVTILYTFTTTAKAGVIPVSSRTVTFTLLTYP